MELKVDITLHGLEPLVEAIQALAVAHSTSALQASEAITKASKPSKKAPPTAAAIPDGDGIKSDAKPEVSTTGGTQDASSPATTVADPAPSQSSPTAQPDAGAAPAAEASSVPESTAPSTNATQTSPQESSDQKASDTADAAPADTVYSDEKLRELAGNAAKVNKDAVKALVTALNVATVSAIPADKRAQFVKDLAAVKAPETV